jgi:hypothetical protein
LDSWNLEPFIARALSLPRQPYLDLQRWKGEPAKGDLGACVKRVMENMDIVSCYDSFDISPCYRLILGLLVTIEPHFLTDYPTLSIKTIAYSLQMAMASQANAVTVEEIDQSLLQIAAFGKRSSSSCAVTSQ